MENKICKQCGNKFEVTNDDVGFYKRISVDVPKCCSDCRQIKRLVFRNERNLYHRKSDLSGKPIISTYSPDKKYTVFSPSEWWGDSWNGLDAGRDFDFSKPFFEQFNELLRDVPHIGILNTNNYNAEYDNFSEQDKNCYLVIAGNRNEDSYYCSYLWDSKNCMDCLNVERSELCYECVDCIKCYNAHFCEKCRNSHDVYFCSDLSSCENCFACAGLRNKKFNILNKQYSEEEYRKILSNPEENQKILQEYEKLKAETPHLYAEMIACENCTGANLRNCKNVEYGFDAFEIEDGKYIENIPGRSKDVYEINGAAHVELCAELVSVAYANKCFACLYSHNPLSDSCYCMYSSGSNNLFGCASLKKNSYCILNKQYSRKEYEKMLPKIIEHMKKTGEWGEFFPGWISPFCYNETLAHERFTVDKQQAEKWGYKWLNEEIKERITAENEQAKADGINIFTCETCDKNYKIIDPERSFYKKIGLQIPKNCPECRYIKRAGKRPPKKLWPRKCNKCEAEVMSPYATEKEVTIYCEKCYLSQMV